MKKVKLFQFKNLSAGLRLFLAGLILYFGRFSPLSAMTIAGMVMAFPTMKRFSQTFKMRLGVGEQAAEKEALLKEVAAQAKAKIDEFKAEFTELINKARSGAITKEVFDAQLKTVTDKLAEFDPAKYKEYQDTLEKMTKKATELEAAMKVQGEVIKKLTDGVPEGKPENLRAALGKFLETPEWKEFVASGGKKKVEFKAPVSITNEYTGTSRVHITTRDNRVVDHPPVVRLNIRDLLTVSPTDMPYLAFIEVYEWNRAAATLTENGSLPESAFKVREATTDAKRIGTSIPISKRMLKSVSWIQNHLATVLPAQVRYFEDFQLLFGDGAGNNPTGIFKVADTFATIINTALVGIAGTVSSVASYNGGTQTLVNFAANQNINNGDRITFAAATEPTYNATFTAIVVGPRQIMIEKAYVAEADTSLWTWSITSRFKNNIGFAQEIDVLKVAKTLVTRQEYSCTGIVMHPDDATIIETLKGNDEHYLDVKRLESGILTIAGVPVVETTAMPSGKFAVGDWALAAALLEFTSLILEFSESTNEKLTNSIMAIIQEEVLFPIYNKFMFVVGDFTTAKAAILKP